MISDALSACAPARVPRRGLTRSAEGMCCALALIFAVASGLEARAAGCPNAGFNAQPSYPVGRPVSVAAGDLNGDGVPDLVSANLAQNAVSVLLGKGQGAFAPAADYAVGAKPYYVVVADFNGDGRADVAAVDSDSNSISLLLADAAGHLGAASAFPVGRFPRAAVAQDFNGDGKSDLVVTNFYDETVSLLLGDGVGGFAPAANFGTGGTGTLSVTAGDFDGDGKPDVAVVGFTSGTVSVLLNNGSGGFAKATVSQGPSSVSALASGDFNGDGKPDVALALNYGLVQIMLGDGKGGLALGRFFRVSTGMQDIKVGDLNSDGKPDLFTANDGSLSVLLGDGQGGFRDPKYYSLGVAAIAPADLNQDGKLDLATVNGVNAASVLFGDGAGGLSTLTLIQTGSASSLSLADLNGDGRLDLVTEQGVLLGDGAGGFGSLTRFPAVAVTMHASVADFNRDGKLDVVVSNANNTVSIFQGDGAGGTGPALSYPASPNPRDVEVADFNRDGNPDVVAVDGSVSAVYVLLGDGRGGLAAARTFALGAVGSAVAVADFDGDGKDDLVVAAPGANKVFVLRGDGAGSFGTAAGFAVGTSPQAVTVGDFNGDGKADAATANNSGTVSVLLGDGAGGFSPAVGLAVGSSPDYITVGDLNGDGNSDLVTADFNSLQVSILLGDGAGGFASAQSFPVSGSPKSVAVGDLNGDGKDDIVVSRDNAAVVMLNTCGAPAAAPPILSAANVSISEGDAGSHSAAVTITLSVASGRTVTADYYTSDQTASAGADYQTVSGHLTFAPGVTSQTINVNALGDKLDEFDETFKLNLTDVLNARADASGGVITITDDDPPPEVSVNGVKVIEGDSGTTPAAFTLSLSGVSGKPISVRYSTADATARAGSDYVAASGTVTFLPGEISKTISVNVNGDTDVEEDETFLVTLSNPINVTISAGQAVGMIVNDDSAVQFGAPSFEVSEADGRASLTINRIGYMGSTVSVTFSTDDDPSPIRCDVVSGIAYARCDYATTVAAITFAPGETQKIVTVPVIDDAHVEGDETFKVRLSAARGGVLGAPSGASVTIKDNDAAGETNPIGSADFFVRMQYIDFLSREPEAGQPWSSVINNCAPGDQTCDRVSVSGNFFRSQEFQLKGLFVFKFYKVTYGRMPLYSEIVADMSSVTGSTTAELIAKKGAFTAGWASRQAFHDAGLDALSYQSFVDTLMGRYGLQQITTINPSSPDDTQAPRVTLTRTALVNSLNAGTLTRGQVVRAMADSDEVSSAEFNPAFVAMQYFGYLRRDPEADGYNAWLRTINANPSDTRSMVNGFVNSTEYRLRFGQP